MLDPKEAGAIWQKHFDTVTPEEFVSRVKRVSPDLAQEMWGDRTVEEICAERRRPVRRARRAFASFGRSVLRLFS
ncbi:hypothetical protein [Longimicrobium sp.]|uniref:hypothetical protein n=1 Tax=Longimicrobium sp. TaxID=2029185 RepID=UPI003B3B5D6B